MAELHQSFFYIFSWILLFTIVWNVLFSGNGRFK